MRGVAIGLLGALPLITVTATAGLGSCAAPLFFNDPFQCPDTSSFDWEHYQNSDVVVRPFQNPHVDRFNYANLQPSYDTSLFYSQNAQAGSQGNLAAVLNFTMSFPTIVIEDSAYVTSSNCSLKKGKSQISLEFADEYAFSLARAWPNTDLVLVINAPSCKPQSDERGVYLVGSMSAKPYTKSIHCQGELKSWEDVSKTLEIGIGHARSNDDQLQDAATTRTATKYWTSDGVMTSSTYLTTALPIHFSTSITATSLQSSSLYRKPSSRPAWVPQDPSHDSSQVGSKTWSTWSQTRMSSSITATQSKSFIAWSSNFTSVSVPVSSEKAIISTTWTPNLSGTGSLSQSSVLPTSSNTPSVSLTATTYTTTTSQNKDFINTTAYPSSATSMTVLETLADTNTTMTSGAETTSILTSHVKSNTSTTLASMNTTTTVSSQTTDSITTSTLAATSTITESNSSTTSEATTTGTTSSTGGFGNSSTVSTTTTLVSVTTKANEPTPPSLSPKLQEIWDAIMDVLEFNDDGTIHFSLPQQAIDLSNGEVPSSTFDPADADSQEALLALNAKYGFDPKQKILSDVQAAIQDAAGSEYAVTPDMNIHDTPPDSYAPVSMVDRGEVSNIDNPNYITAENQKAYLAADEQQYEDLFGGVRESDDTETRGNDEASTGTPDSTADGTTDNLGRRSSYDLNAFNSKLMKKLQRKDEDEDEFDEEEFAWNMVDMLGEMGCKPCEAAAKFKEAFDETMELVGLIDFLIRQGKYRVEASVESRVNVAVPAQLLVDEWWRGNKLSCDDASFSVSSLIIETKLLVDITNKRLVSGEITTSVTSKSNLQLKFESGGTMLGDWEFIAASLDLQSLSAPGIFRISPRFLYNFGVNYQVTAAGTFRAGASIETTDAQVAVDIGSKAVLAAQDWKPSRIDLTYPSVNPWEWALVNPYTKTTIAMHLDIFGTRYNDAIVLTTQTTIGFEEGRVYLTESRQCQARNMKQVSTLNTLSKVSVMGQPAETLYKASYPLNTRCWQPADEPALCPEGVYDGDTYEDGGYTWRVTCGEAVTQDTAFYEGNHLLGTSNGIDYENWPWSECTRECAENYYETSSGYTTGNPYGGCQMAVWLPQSGFNCAWLNSKDNARIEGYGMAVADRMEYVDCCEYSRLSNLLVGCDYVTKCPDLDVCALSDAGGLPQCKVEEASES